MSEVRPWRYRAQGDLVGSDALGDAPQPKEPYGLVDAGTYLRHGGKLGGMSKLEAKPERPSHGFSNFPTISCLRGVDSAACLCRTRTVRGSGHRAKPKVDQSALPLDRVLSDVFSPFGRTSQRPSHTIRAGDRGPRPP